MSRFFEWQVLPSKRRQPYFVYFNDSGNASRCQLSAEGVDASKGSTRPLTLAGIYDVWSPTSTGDTGLEGEALETFTIITVPATKALSWLHDRMPAVLDRPEAVDAWLDHGTVSAPEVGYELCSRSCFEIDLFSRLWGSCLPWTA
jgi:putative SOS response-associated peptidase YedK